MPKKILLILKGLLIFILLIYSIVNSSSSIPVFILLLLIRINFKGFLTKSLGGFLDFYNYLSFLTLSTLLGAPMFGLLILFD